MGGIILFDGECNFCNKSVQFIIERDPSGYYKFASLQSEIGKELLGNFSDGANANSFVLIENGTCYTKSTAALRVCKHLKGIWKVLPVFLCIPKQVRNIFYDFIARNRYKWFGQINSCTIPSPEIRKRFL